MATASDATRGSPPAEDHDAQPNLFEPSRFERSEHDRPMPYTMTARGRRLVDPTTPDLRVVGGDPAGHRIAAPDTGASDSAVPPVGGPEQARVRALRRAGANRGEIGQRLGLSPLAVAVLDAPDQLAASTTAPGMPGSRPAEAGAAVGPSGAGRMSPDDRRAAGRAMLAVAGDIDEAGLTVTTDRINAAAVLVDWLRHDEQVPPASVRVVLRVADAATADIVSRAWADRLDLGRDRVATVPWPRAAGPRDVQAIVRVTGPALATRLRRDLAGWPAQPADQGWSTPATPA